MASRNDDFSERCPTPGNRKHPEYIQDDLSERNLFDLRTPDSSHAARGVHSWPWHPPLAADQSVSSTTTVDPKQRPRSSSPEYQHASPNIWERSPSHVRIPSPENQPSERERQEIYTPYPEQPQGVEPHIRKEFLGVLKSMNATKNTSPNAKSFSRKRFSDDEEDYLPPSKRHANGSYQRYDVAASQQSQFSVIAALFSPAKIAQLEAGRERRVAQLRSVSQLNEDAKTQMSSASPNGYKNDLYNTSPPPPPRLPTSAESVWSQRQFLWKSIMTPAAAGDDAESQKQPPQNSLFGQNSALLMEPRHMHNPNRRNLFDIRSPSIFSRDSAFPIGGLGISVDLGGAGNPISEPPNMLSHSRHPYRVENSVENEEDLHSMLNNPAFGRQEEEFANFSDTDSITLTEEAPVPSIEGSVENDSDGSDGLEGYLSDFNDRDVDEPLNIVKQMDNLNEQVADMQNVIRENHEGTTALNIQAFDQTQQIASLLETVGLFRNQSQNQADEASRLRDEIAELKDETAGLARRNMKLVDLVIRLAEQVIHHEQQLTELGRERVSELENDASVNKNEVVRLKNEVLKLERDALKKEVEELRKTRA